MDRPKFLHRLAALDRTQAEMAEACGLSLTTVYCWGHAGRHPIPVYAGSLLSAWEEIDRLRGVIDARIAREGVGDVADPPDCWVGRPAGG